MYPLALSVILSLGLGSVARATVITFDDLSDGDAVTTQYAGQGVQASGASTLTAGLSLNEFDFPPHSGANVVAPSGQEIVFTFAIPVVSVGAFFTYAEPVEVILTDALGGTHALSSALSANFVSSGNTPNEFLGLDLALGITRFAASAPTGLFALDDLTFRTATTVPDSLPGWAGSLVLGLTVAGLGRFSRERKA